MKKVIISFTLLTLQAVVLFGNCSPATTLYFEDKNGLKDSLIILLQPSEEEAATIQEVSQDVALQAMKDSTRWVWLTRNWREKDAYSNTYSYQPYAGHMSWGMERIYIPADRLPVTITWDQQFFIDNSLITSVLSDMKSWFDAVCGEEDLHAQWLTQANSCVLHNKYSGTPGCTFEKWGEVLVKVLGLSVGTDKNQAVESISADDRSSASKTLHDGVLYIIRPDGKTYTSTGTEVHLP